VGCWAGGFHGGCRERSGERSTPAQSPNELEAPNNAPHFFSDALRLFRDGKWRVEELQDFATLSSGDAVDFFTGEDNA